MVKFIWLAILTVMSYPLSAQESEPYVVISLQKTQCYGNCPAFKFEVYSDLSAKYSGIAHVEQLGDWSTTLTNEQHQHIMKEFEESDFFEFADRYYQEISDRPTTYVTYSDGDRVKKVMDYYGAPEKLKQLEAKVEKLITELEWKKERNQ